MALKIFKLKRFRRLSNFVNNYEKMLKNTITYLLSAEFSMSILAEMAKEKEPIS